MFRGLAGIIYKELLQLSRDPVTLFATIMIPIIQLTIFGYAIDTEVRDVQTAVLDMDKTSYSRDFVQRLEATGLNKVVSYVENSDALYEEIVSGRAKVGVKIPPGYARNIDAGRSAEVQVLVDGSNNTVAGQTLGNVQNLGLTLSIELAQVKATADNPPVLVKPRLLFNPSLKSANFFVPGLVGILLFLMTMMLTSFGIVRERELGTLEQLMVTPISKSALMLGKVLPYLVLGLIQMLIVLLAAQVIFGITITGNYWLLIGLALIFVFSSLGLGLIISTVAKTQLQAMMGSFMLMLPSVLLSGFIFPRESMPLVIYWLSFLLPVTYFIEILRGIILRGAGFSVLWDEAACLALMGVLLLTIAAARFRKTVS